MRMTPSVLTSFIALTIVHAAASGASVSVAGVAVDADSQARVAGVGVRLTVSEGGEGVIADDTTSKNGVYNLSAEGVQGSVDSLWVISDGKNYIAKPVAALLDRPVRNVRRGRADDLKVRELGAGKLAKADIAWSLASAEDTAAIVIRAGVKANDAWSWIRDTAIKIINSGPPGLRDPRQLEDVLAAAREQVNREIVKEPLLIGRSAKDFLAAFEEPNRRGDR